MGSAGASEQKVTILIKNDSATLIWNTESQKKYATKLNSCLPNWYLDFIDKFSGT